HVSYSSDSDEDSSVKLDSLRVLNIYKVNKLLEASDPWFVDLEVERNKLTLELDCGTPTTVISNSWHSKYFSHLSLEKTKAVLSTWSREKIKPRGVLQLNVNHEGKTSVLGAILAPDDFQPLCGREWIRALNLDWRDYLTNSDLNADVHSSNGSDLNLDPYKVLFSEGL